MIYHYIWYVPTTKIPLMKNLTNVLLALVFSFIMISCQQEETASEETDFLATASEGAVGVDHDGEFFFTDKAALIEKWEYQLRHTGTKLPSSRFKLVTGDFNGKSESTILVSENSDGTTKTAIALDKIGDEYFINQKKGTVTCSGTCPDGCDPVDKGDRWICSDCNVFGSYTCNKSVTVVIGTED